MSKKKEIDMEAEILQKFQKNAEKADKLREKFEGNFIAVLEQKVIGIDSDCESLLSKIPEDTIKNQELYIGYAQRDDEVLLL